jgi:hypothetical protein
MQYLLNLVGLLWHLDGAEIHRNCENFVWSWGSYYGCGSVWERKIPMCLIPHRFMVDPVVKKRVHEIIAKYIAHELKAFQRGVGNTHGFYGEQYAPSTTLGELADQPLASGICAIWMGMKADSKAIQDANSFDRWYKCIQMCRDCLANNPYKHSDPDLNFKNFREDALHRLTQISNEFYLRTTSYKSPYIIDIPGGYLQLCWKDIMHADAIGYGRDLAACVIQDMLKAGQLEGVGDLALRALWAEGRKWCKCEGYHMFSGHAFSKNNLNIVPGRYPEMASSYKAATVKQVLLFLADKTTKISDANPRCEESLNRAACLHYWASWHYVLDHGGSILSVEDSKTAQRVGRLFLLSYQKLSDAAIARRRLAYKIRTKHHTMDHQVDRITVDRLNPKNVACFVDEDFLGKLKRLGQQTHGSNVMLRTLQRYLLLIRIRWYRIRNTSAFGGW